MVLHKLFCFFLRRLPLCSKLSPILCDPGSVQQSGVPARLNGLCSAEEFIMWGEWMPNLANWLSVTWEQPRDPRDRILLIIWCPTESCHQESHGMINTIQTALPHLPFPVSSWKLPIYLEMFSIYLENKVLEQTRHPVLPQWILLSRLACISAYTYRYVCLPHQHLALCKSAQSEMLQENPRSQINSNPR